MRVHELATTALDSTRRCGSGAHEAATLAAAREARNQVRRSVRSTMKDSDVVDGKEHCTVRATRPAERCRASAVPPRLRVESAAQRRQLASARRIEGATTGMA